jgi:hypothetical protein
MREAKNPARHYAMIAIVGVLIASNLFLVLQLSHPYVGEIATSPEPLREVIRILLRSHRALRWRMIDATIVDPIAINATAATSHHVCMAQARNARCVLAEIRWRWTLKVL